MSDTDLELLARYTRQHAEDAFAELVRRHVDLVHSAALRQVRSPQLAEEVAQSTFIKLARLAPVLAPDTILTAWLYQVTRREAVDVVRREARRQLREQIATEMNALNVTTADWTHIEPLLDEAMSSLDDTDRAAVLLRYFENQSLREVGATLGTSDDAAQKRVSRAVERLREFFAKRGVTVGVGGLVVAISANAVQAAPAGLAVAISTAAALAGTAVSTSTVIAATKTIALTTLQRTLVTAAVAVLAGAGIYEAGQASQLRGQNQSLQQQQAPLAEQVRQLQRERDDARNRLAGSMADNLRLKANPPEMELLKLRGEVGTLRQQLALAETALRASPGGFAKLLNDPAMKDYFYQTQLNTIRYRFSSVFKELKLTPEQTEQVVSAMGDLLMKNAVQMYSMPQGQLNGAEIAQAAAARETEFASQLQPLIGDSGVARLKEFREEIPAQATIALMNGKLGDSQLEDAQSGRLLKIIQAEPYELTRGVAGDWDPAFWGKPEAIDEHLRNVTASNQRILQQAGGFLTPDQFAALSTVLSNGINERIAQAEAFIQKH